MTPRRFNTQEAPAFLGITLKLEDKIILGVGALFLLSLLIFIGFANKIFNHFDEQNKRWDESTQRAQNIHGQPITEGTQASQETAGRDTFKEREEAFYHLQKAFEENQKKRDAAFKAMEKNFHERFKKAAAEHEKGGERLFKIFEEAAARSDAAFNKTAAEYSKGLSNFATGHRKKDKQHDARK